MAGSSKEINLAFSLRKVLHLQIFHFLAAILALVFASYLDRTGIVDLDNFKDVFGIPGRSWYYFGWIIPPIHQIFVVLCWRTELYGKLLSRAVGSRLAFAIYCVGFVFFICCRLVSIQAMSMSDSGSLTDADLPNWMLRIIICAILPLWFWTVYSTARYFSFRRAVGADHFHPETYRAMSFEKRGIFKYMNNAMYKVGITYFYVPGVMRRSKMALLIAAFNQAFIWIFYYTTELPDMKVIYDQKTD